MGTFDNSAREDGIRPLIRISRSKEVSAFMESVPNLKRTRESLSELADFHRFSSPMFGRLNDTYRRFAVVDVKVTTSARG